MSVVFRKTDCPSETEKVGRRLGSLLQAGDIICLEGDLGAGKTCFTRGIAMGLDVDPSYVSSPTFVLAQEYRGRQNVCHMDLYRLSSSSDFYDIGLYEYLEGDNVVIIEWPEVIDNVLASLDRLCVRISAGADPSERTFEFTPYGLRPEAIVEEMNVDADPSH